MRYAFLVPAMLMLIVCISCEKADTPEKAAPVTGASVQDLKQTACDSAHNARTCSTRLPELGFVTKEDCCELFNKCCE